MGTEAFLPGGKSPSTEASTNESQIANQLFSESTPVRQELFKQILEGLQTGGVQAKIPIIQSALESSRVAQSNTMKGIDENLATSGLSGTPFGARTRAEAQEAGNQQIGQIPTNIIRDFLSVAPGYSSQASGQALQGLSAVTGSEAAIRNAQIAAVSQILSSSIAAGEKAGMACWVAGALYGEGSLRQAKVRYYVYNQAYWLTVWLYFRAGKWASRQRWLLPLLRPWFNRMAEKSEGVLWAQY